MPLDLIPVMLLAAAENDCNRVAALLATDRTLARARGPHPYWGGRPCPLEAAIEWGSMDAIRLLLDAGADPNETSVEYGNWPPLLLAIARGRLRSFPAVGPYLIERGARVDAIAAAGLGLTGYLHDADLDVCGPNGTTPLHWAGTVEVAELLLERGADPNALDRRSNGAERNAAGGRPEIARLILKKKNAIADIHLAAAMNDVDRVREVLDVDPDAISRQTYQWDSVANFSGGMPLHIAASHGRVEVARLLLARGAEVNALCLAGAAPLHYTAWRGQVEMARVLLEHGADPNVVDAAHRSTPLGWARFQRWPDLVDLLAARMS